MSRNYHTARLFELNGRAAAQTPFSDGFRADAKAIGAKWDGAARAWTVELERADELRAALASNFKAVGLVDDLAEPAVETEPAPVADTKPVEPVMPRKSARDFQTEYAYLQYQAQRIVSYWMNVVASGKRGDFANRHGDVLAEFRVKLDESGALDVVEVQLFEKRIKAASYGRYHSVPGCDVPETYLLDAGQLLEDMEGWVETKKYSWLSEKEHAEVA